MFEFTLFDNRYRVINQIGKGGMGVVFEVDDMANANGSVALKYCPETDIESQRRFCREVRIMANINHPNVMPVLTQNDSHNPPYFTMPIAACSIADEIPFYRPTEDILNIFLEICKGVKAIHDAGFTHRDLKPANIMRMQDSTVVISDLGLAKFNERDSTILTQIGMGLGTNFYSAPEQLIGDAANVDARADVYALGKILYELISGDIPFSVDYRKIPDGLKQIVENAIQNPLDLRYQSVSELMNAIQNYFHSQQKPQVITDIEKEKLISELRHSKTFAATHLLIERLEKYPSFTLYEVNRILKAAIKNDQLGWIVTDSDVSDFLNRIAVPHMANISDADQRNILDKVIQERNNRD